MSTLNVGSIKDLTGKPLVEPTGSVLQVVNTNTVGNNTNVNTTSSTYVTTGFSLSITPKSASSKLLVICNFNSLYNGGGADDGAAFRLYRNGTAITTANNGDNLSYNNTTPGATYIPMQIIHYVNSNNTNSTTFELYFCDQWGGTATFVNLLGTNSMTIMEIAA